MPNGCSKIGYKSGHTFCDQHGAQLRRAERAG
jgi:hypothetical protein